MDNTLTFTDPAVPNKGLTVNFNLGGIFVSPSHLDHLNFKAKLDGIHVYNEDFPVNQDVSDVWTYMLPFDIPSYAPSGHFDVEIAAIDGSSEQLFVIEAKFTL